MKYYVGIDLGTTNSAICTFDGKDVRVWGVSGTGQVTPSAIYVDKRGNRYYGTRAYNNAASDPENAATLFKRFMGTNEKIHIKNTDEYLTPEQCSAEILKVLYGYLPEEIRNSDEVATVITVPAAFNQMKKDATVQAAELAGIQNVSLMQEPVAAVMSIMKETNQKGTFLVYDLGGGTFDISIAENIGGRVNLIAHGGKEMCGGRDIDRAIFNEVTLPWLRDNFDLPDDVVVNQKYRKLVRQAQFAGEVAKLELSSRSEAMITLSEVNLNNVTDESGEEIYIEVPINRDTLDDFLEGIINDTIEETRAALSKNGLTANDIETIVFVGGPTNYKPLRDKVCEELALKPCIDVNPMTAVAEGASIYAESIDWSQASHAKKSSIANLDTGIDIEFRVTSRTEKDKGKIQCVLKTQKSGYKIEVISKDTGWTSGQTDLRPNLIITVPVEHNGDNTFEVKIYDSFGKTQKIENPIVVITKTYATIGSIPSSHSIGIQMLEKLNGKETLEFLVKEGDALPKTGALNFRAAQSLRGGSSDSINIKLWEGDILDPVTDNRFIGVLKISGTDFDDDEVVKVGADIVVDYEFLDSGELKMSVSIPSANIRISDRKLYSRQEGQLDLDDIDYISEQGQSLLQRVKDLQSEIDDENLDDAYDLASHAAYIDESNKTPEDVQSAYNDLLDAKKLLYRVRRDNYSAIARREYDELYTHFFGDNGVHTLATPAQSQEIKNLFDRAKRAIDRGDSSFDDIQKDIRRSINGIVWSNEKWVIAAYRAAFNNPNEFFDRAKFNTLKQKADKYLASGDIHQLRQTMFEMNSIRKRDSDGIGMFDITNITRG
ncbi:MAG: Hsp70 family protein [Spirochaetales bacterium]|nr:Hsp70 family protein [Spirochaetales bacterium]